VWAIKRVEAGKDLAGFNNPDIPEDLAAEISGMLAECKTVEDVKAAFKSVEQAEADPISLLALELHRANNLLERTNGNGSGAH
jgi:hypothetical protein